MLGFLSIFGFNVTLAVMAIFSVSPPHSVVSESPFASHIHLASIDFFLALNIRQAEKLSLPAVLNKLLIML